ncbi:hypothetical protein CEXT_567891 [Caerostris extrusa]|uniref:Ycf15 n=1 Tax=Caerostris extrusa TaxID=172846 RepID=A0AAV4W0I9_CAEEX|nr:hypothetical protein CEXT_567891 [Caerostris extrusa]
MLYPSLVHSDSLFKNLNGTLNSHTREITEQKIFLKLPTFLVGEIYSEDWMRIRNENYMSGRLRTSSGWGGGQMSPDYPSDLVW